MFNRLREMPSLPRQILGVLLIVCGILGFLPIVGFWMIPLGLLVLSADFRWARRGYLSIHSWIRKWRYRNK
jgi:hypothetical protein